MSAQPPRHCIVYVVSVWCVGVNGSTTIYICTYNCERPLSRPYPVSTIMITPTTAPDIIFILFTHTNLWARAASSIGTNKKEKNNNIVGADASHERWAERSSLATYIRIPHTIVDTVMMESGAVNVYAKRVDCMRGINIVRGVAVLLTTLFDCRFVRSINTNWIELKRMRAVCCGGWVAFCK